MKILLSLGMGLVFGWGGSVWGNDDYDTDDDQSTQCSSPPSPATTALAQNQADQIVNSFHDNMATFLKYLGSIDRLIEENSEKISTNPFFQDLFQKDTSWKKLRREYIDYTRSLGATVQENLENSLYITQTVPQFVNEVKKKSTILKKIFYFLWDETHKKRQSILQVFYQEAKQKLEEPYKENELYIQKKIFDLLITQIDLKIGKRNQAEWLSQNFEDFQKVKRLSQIASQDPNRVQKEINGLALMNTHYAEILLGLQ